MSKANQRMVFSTSPDQLHPKHKFCDRPVVVSDRAQVQSALIVLFSWLPFRLHSLVCKQAPVRSSRHHTLIDFVARAFVAAGVPVPRNQLAWYAKIARDQMVSR